MRVQVRIFGNIAGVYGGKHTVEAQDNSTISLVIEKIQEKAGFARSNYLGEWRIGSPNLAIIVNGKNVDLLDGVETRLHNNDDIVITPYVVGG